MEPRPVAAHSRVIEAAEEIAASGGRVLQIRTAAELKARQEVIERRAGDTDSMKREAEKRIGLRRRRGRLVIPDVSIEFVTAQGEVGHRNIQFETERGNGARVPERAGAGPRSVEGRGPERPARRSSHRRDYDSRAEPRRGFEERIDAAVVDVGMYRAVALRDLVERQFGGNSFAGGRGIARAEARGWVARTKAKGPQGGEFVVVVATAAGAERARELLARSGRKEQETFSGVVKRGELAHDAAVYRAVGAVGERIEAVGGSVVRVCIDAELKGALARVTEAVRARAGRVAAEESRREAAARLGLPVRAGQVMVPDAQVEYVNARGEVGRCNVEVATEHYSGATIREKARAGFVVVGATARAAKAVSRALGGMGSSSSKRGGRPRREEEVIEL